MPSSRRRGSSAGGGSASGSGSGDGRMVAYKHRRSGDGNTAVVSVSPGGGPLEKYSEDEWVTKRRVEVTTKKNIETRVKRHLLVEDGKIIEDSGPLITTDTTVDTSEKKDENTEFGAAGAARFIGIDAPINLPPTCVTSDEAAECWLRREAESTDCQSRRAVGPTSVGDRDATQRRCPTFVSCEYLDVLVVNPAGSMWHKGSPDLMENSSGYASNATSMNAPPRYATVGRSRSALKRTPSVVEQPTVPSSYLPNPIPKPKRTYATKEMKRPKGLLARTGSRASKSSGNSSSYRADPQPQNGRHGEPKNFSRRSHSRVSHSKIRRPSSRTSSKGSAMRRQNSTRRGKQPAASSHQLPSTSPPASTKKRLPKQVDGIHSPQNLNSSRDKEGKKYLLSWTSKLNLKRARSLNAKKNSDKKSETRPRDKRNQGVVMMNGVDHIKQGDGYGNSILPSESSRTHRPAAVKPGLHVTSVKIGPVGMNGSRRVDVSPRRSERRSDRDMDEHRSRYNSPSGSALLYNGSPVRFQRYASDRHSSSQSPSKERPSSELSSSTAPRPPLWRAESQESLNETITCLTDVPNKLDDKTKMRQHYNKQHRSNNNNKIVSAPSARTGREQERPSVLDFIKRTFSIKSKDKPKVIKRRPQMTSAYESSPERPIRKNNRLRPTKSFDHLSVEQPENVTYVDSNRFQSLPRGKPKSSGTTLSRRLQNMGWGTMNKANGIRNNNLPRNGLSAQKNNNELRKVSKNNELIVPPASRQAKFDHQQNRRNTSDEAADESILPINQQRRTLSQPSLLLPQDRVDAAEEPFSHYANLPFQLPARRPPSPRPDEQELDSALTLAKRAASQPSLLQVQPNGPMSDPTEERTDESGARQCSRVLPTAGVVGSRGRAAWRPSIDVTRRGILKRRKSADAVASGREVKNVNVANEQNRLQQHRQLLQQQKHDTNPRRPAGILGIASNLAKNAFKHRKHGDDQVPDGYVPIAGGGVVSEKFTNVSNIHEEKENVREEEEVHQLGEYNNQDVSRAVRDGGDALALVRHRQGSHQEDRLVDPRNGQRRVLHEAAKTWRTVDTEDVHEKSHRDKSGELITETARTAQREQFSNVQVPDDDSDAQEGSEEDVQTSSKNRRHVRDVDMMEYFSVPRGGRLADGIKLGEGLRHVQENIEEDREGEEFDSLSQRMRRRRQLGYKPEGQTLTKTPIEYHEEEKTRRKETNKWLESHFGSESGQSHSSEDGDRQRGSSRAKDETDRRRETSVYEYQKTGGSARRGNAEPTSWERSEKYSRQVRETPERTYIKETRESPQGGYERVEVRPAGSTKVYAVYDDDKHHRVAKSQSIEDDCNYRSRSHSNRAARGVHFDHRPHEVVDGRHDDSRRLATPPSRSPPPPPPPRYKRKNRDNKDMSPLSHHTVDGPANHYASSPIRDRYERESVPSQAGDHRRETTESQRSHRSTSQRQSDRDSTPIRFEDHRRNQRVDDRAVVKEYHFHDAPKRSSPPQQSDSRDVRDSPSRRTYFLGEDPHTGGRDRSLSTDSARKSAMAGDMNTSGLSPRYGTGSGSHRSSDQVDRTESQRGYTVDRRYMPSRRSEDTVDARPQTLPRKPRDKTVPSFSRTSRLADSSRFGGSMVNVSSTTSRPAPLSPPAKPYRASVQRSNSMYSQAGHLGSGSRAGQELDIGLKSPDIISKIQRSTSMRRDKDITELDRYRNTSDDVHRNNVENAKKFTSGGTSTMPRSLRRNSPPQVLTKPKMHGDSKDNFMRGLMQKAPELYGVLHGDERKDSKTPSPKHSPPMTPLQRARSPTSPLGVERDVFPKTPPVFKRIERLRADEEVVTKDSRSRSSTPLEDIRHLRLGSHSSSGETGPQQLNRYRYNDDLYTSPTGRHTPSGSTTHTSSHRRETQTTRPRHHTPQYVQYKPKHEHGGVVIEVRDWNTR